MATLTRTPRVLVGSALVLVGGLLMLNQLDLVSVELDLLDLWPWVFIVIAGQRFGDRDLTGGLVFLCLGSSFLIPRYFPGIELRDIFQYWPLFLVALGILFVAGGLFGNDRKQRRSRKTGSERGKRSDGLVMFRNLDLDIDSEAYRGDGFVSVAGQVKLDLTEAELAPEGATIEVFSMWSSIEIRVPRHWSVELRVLPFMGGAEDKSRPPGPIEGYEPRLVITGFAWMAGVEVLN